MIARVCVLAPMLLGCSLVWAPDPNDVAGDGGDAGDTGHDAGMPDAGDAGYDGGPDAGCRPSQSLETGCDNRLDEDCDGLVDCFDYDCRGFEDCCQESSSESLCVQSLTAWRILPASAAADVEYDTASCPDRSITAFSSGGFTRAVISEECQPISFGMRYDLAFEIESDCMVATCDWAALTFTNVQALAEGAQLDHQLRVLVSADGSAHVERAGATIGTPAPRGTFPPRERIPLRVELETAPGPDARDVLYATITAVGATPRVLLARTAIIPIHPDLRCFEGGVSQGAGLYVAIEGAGSEVDVHGPVQVIERACASPSQFRAQSNDVSVVALDQCAAGGAGSPSLVSYCVADCEAPDVDSFQWEAWVDSSVRPRDEDFFSNVDFGVCSYSFVGPALPNGSSGDWRGRGSVPVTGFQWPIPPSSRDVTVLPITDENAVTRVQTLWYAYAQRVTEGMDRYAIFGGSMQATPTARPMAGATALVSPGEVDDVACRSLRDPLLIADWRDPADMEPYVDGAWLLFTCDPTTGGRRSIHAVHLAHPSMTVDSTRTFTVLARTAEPTSYAAFGVSGPEGFSEISDAELTWRIWYGARNSDGDLQLAFAQGRGPLGADVPPPLEPYPANPILNGSAEILDGDCSMGCDYTGASVTSVANDRSSYQFLIARARNTPAGAVHELVPLLQPRPRD